MNTLQGSNWNAVCDDEGIRIYAGDPEDSPLLVAWTIPEAPKWIFDYFWDNVNQGANDYADALGDFTAEASTRPGFGIHEGEHPSPQEWKSATGDPPPVSDELPETWEELGRRQDEGPIPGAREALYAVAGLADINAFATVDYKSVGVWIDKATLSPEHQRLASYIYYSLVTPPVKEDVSSDPGPEACDGEQSAPGTTWEDVICDLFERAEAAEAASPPEEPSSPGDVIDILCQILDKCHYREVAEHNSRNSQTMHSMNLLQTICIELIAAGRAGTIESLKDLAKENNSLLRQILEKFQYSA